MNASMELMVETLYDGVLSPQAWGEALQAVCTRLDAYAFHQLSVDRETMSVGTVAVSMNSTPPPADKVLEYETHYAALDVRMPLFWSVSEGELMLDHEHLSPSSFNREPIYTEFLASVGMRHTACIPARDGKDSRDFVGFMRHLDQRPHGTAERAVLEFLQPHIVRANRLRFGTAALAPEAALGFSALETLPQAVVVMGPQCQIRYINGAAQRWMAREVGLAVRHGRLHCTDPVAQAQLSHHVAAACGAGTVRSAGVVRLGSGSAGVTASVLPLRAAHPLAGPWHATPQALMTWHCGAGLWGAEQLSTALGLSPVEARLALHLAQGHSVKAFAAVQGCSWHTVRTHVKNLLRKTGCHGQQELVRLVQSLALH